MYYTDPATDWNNTFKNKDLSLGKITIKYDENWKPYMETCNFINGQIEHGRVDITRVWSFDQGKELWDAYFAKYPAD